MTVFGGNFKKCSAFSTQRSSDANVYVKGVTDMMGGAKTGMRLSELH
jgi:hypothetical protein